MAKIDPQRRAEIGREKRARTRAQIIAAASSLYAQRAPESVTVDEVVLEAGLAKGTFYGHFTGLDDLTTAVSDEMVRSFDELLQPGRLALSDPARRIAFGCNAFITKALEDHQWATLAARMMASAPNGIESARQRLLEDLRLLADEATESVESAEVNVAVVVGIMLQALRAIGNSEVTAEHRPLLIRAILRSIGLSPAHIDRIMAQNFQYIGKVTAPAQA